MKPNESQPKMNDYRGDDQRLQYDDRYIRKQREDERPQERPFSYKWNNDKKIQDNHSHHSKQKDDSDKWNVNSGNNSRNGGANSV